MLNGSTISLRPVRETDLDDVHERSLEVEARGAWFPVPTQSLIKYRASFAESGFWSPEQGTFLIVDADDRKVGQVSWGKLDGYGFDLELAYRVYDRANMGRGVATEAVNLLIEYLFGWLPIHRLILYIHVDNVPSNRVAEKCGFTKEGIAREGWFHRGTWHDLAIYSLIRDERDARRES